MTISNKRTIPFLVLFLLAVSYLLYHTSLALPPSFIHAWTQSERYAIALQFLNNKFDILHPATFNLQTVEGITRMDLPLNEFIVALIMKLLGTTSPAIFRIYTLCAGITGVVFLYMLTKRITGSEIKSWLAAAFVFFAPVFTYYQTGFIPCVPAISFVFAAYYYLHCYKHTQSRRHFYACLLFFLLAAMIRLPFLIFLFAFCIQQGFMFIQKRKLILFELTGFVIVFLIFIIYYFHNVHIGKIYGNMFLDKFLPASSFSMLLEIIRQMYNHWMLQYFTVWHYIILAIAVVSAFMRYRKQKELTDKPVWFSLLIVGCGELIYFLLMSSQYFDHDYYFLDTLFLPVVLLFVLCLDAVPEKNNRLIFISFVVVCIMFMFGDSRSEQLARYRSKPDDRGEITRYNFSGSEQYLDSIGVSKDAKILVIESYSTNIPLYMMNRRGYTVYQTNRDNAEYALFHTKWDFVVIQDVFLFSDVLRYYPVVSAVLEPVSGNGKITVYKRSKNIRSVSPSRFLKKDDKNIVYRNKTIFDEETRDAHFDVPSKIMFVPEFSSNGVVLEPDAEYSAAFHASPNEIKARTDFKIHASWTIYSEQPSDIQAVASIINNGETVYYQSFRLSDYYKPGKSKQKAMFEFVVPKFTNVNDQLSIYLWNPSHASLKYDDMEVVIYK
jgi:dolichyl-phosphate-mannose-protein mannosyltransferase